MIWAVLAVLTFLFIVLIGVGAIVIKKQTEIDTPVTGELVIDQQVPDEPAGVYFYNLPGSYKSGTIIKLRVKVIRGDSQGKHTRE